MSIRTISSATVLGLLFAACSSTSASVGTEANMSTYDMAIQSGEAYTLSVLRAGDPSMLPKGEELSKLTREHAAFVEDLFQDSFLLTSGPLVSPRAESNLRGMFFLDSADVDAAHARACDDPATLSGVFEMESMPFVSQTDLRALPAIERGFRMQRGENNVVSRPYVIVTVETSGAADAVISQMGEVVLLTGHVTGGSFEGQTLCVLDCKTVAEAQVILSGATSVMDNFEFHPWVASTSVAEIR